MPEVVAIEWVIGLAVGGLVLGLAAGYGLSLVGGAKSKVNELQSALDKAEEELADYKREVFGQFAETAEKFRALDKSYNDLHRQLATSSVALCGDAATPLLAGPGNEEAVLEEKEVDEDTAEVNDGVSENAAEASTADEAPQEPREPQEHQEKAAADVEAATTDTPATETVAGATLEPAEAKTPEEQPQDDIVVAEKQNEATAGAAEEVPVLTDTEVPPRRETA